MAEGRARARLAIAAERLNAASGASHLPPLFLLTDDERLPDPLPSIRALPKGSGVVLRSRSAARREALVDAVMRLARQRDLIVLVADDPELASRCGAHGLHLPEAKLATALHWRARHPRWRITCAAHTLGSVARAQRFGLDAVLLSPVFPTQSHPERATIGAARLGHIAGLASMPVYALGGVDDRTVGRLPGLRLGGIAAIVALDTSPSRDHGTALRP